MGPTPLPKRPKKSHGFCLMKERGYISFILIIIISFLKFTSFVVFEVAATWANGLSNTVRYCIIIVEIESLETTC